MIKLKNAQGLGFATVEDFLNYQKGADMADQDHDVELAAEQAVRAAEASEYLDEVPWEKFGESMRRIGFERCDDDRWMLNIDGPDCGKRGEMPSYVGLNGSIFVGLDLELLGWTVSFLVQLGNDPEGTHQHFNDVYDTPMEAAAAGRALLVKYAQELVGRLLDVKPFHPRGT